VREYAEAKLAGAVFPPSHVFRLGDRFVVVDGRHRILADMENGLTETEVVIHEGSSEDALIYSLGCNADHGLPRTQADKRRAIGLALRAFGDRTDRWIAGICKVNHKTVAVVRAELEFGDEITTSSHRQGQDGKLYSGSAGGDPTRLDELEEIVTESEEACQRTWLAIASLAVLEGRPLREVFDERRPADVTSDVWELLWGFHFDDDFARLTDANKVLPTNSDYDSCAYRAAVEVDGEQRVVVEISHDAEHPGYLQLTVVDLATGDMTSSGRPIAAWSLGRALQVAVGDEVFNWLTPEVWQPVSLADFEPITTMLASQEGGVPC
jgi:hypothetical protein